MIRKDLVLISRAICDSRSGTRNENLELTLPEIEADNEMRNIWESAIDTAALNLAASIARTDPQFNQALFLRACGLQR
jgi:hypothetical protein